MQSPEQVIETYFLDHRHALLELAAFFDRLDAACERAGRRPAESAKLRQLREAIRQLTDQAAEPTGDRTSRMLTLFSEA